MIVTVVVCFLLPHICGLDQDVTEITAAVEFASVEAASNLRNKWT
jgi:hypothetical protein